MRFREPVRLVTRKSGHRYWLFREHRGVVHKIPYAGDMPKVREKIVIPPEILERERAERAAAKKTTAPGAVVTIVV